MDEGNTMQLYPEMTYQRFLDELHDNNVIRIKEVIGNRLFATVHEAMQILKCRETKLYELMRSEKLQYFNDENGKRIFHVEALHNAMLP